jgi:hypothetical protein
MKQTLKFSLFFTLIIFSHSAFAQKTNPAQIPLMRQIFHENIGRTQQAILNADGLADNQFVVSNDSVLNEQLTYAVTNEVDSLGNAIEIDTALNNNNKIKFLRGLNETLKSFLNEYYFRIIKPVLLPDLINAFGEGIAYKKINQSIAPVVEKNDLEVGKILLSTIAYNDDPDMTNCKAILVMKDCKRHPEKALFILSNHPEITYADSLIITAAYNYPETLYDYAAASNPLGERIRQNNDPLVKTISFMASQKSGRQYFPFLDNIYKGKLSYREVDSVMNDSLKYYNLLVQTEIDYADRIRKKDTPMGMKEIDYKLKIAGDLFINTINGLHESPDDIRFKVIKPMNQQELYYLAVTHEEEIYTSSYVHGIYPYIFRKTNNQSGDSLLMSVRFDHFKKWIKMAANYNELDDFLKRMDKDNAELLMKAFVDRLDRTQNLEDAVDVADSYSSITDTDIKQLILTRVQKNLAAAQTSVNERALNIYNILNTLFLSMGDSSKVDVSKELGIQPVYFMPNASMKDSAGRIIVQQFFYSDKDGKDGYRDFVSSFSNANWKIENEKEWIIVSSAKGTPVIIYANKPLGDETDNLDEDGQHDLYYYLNQNNFKPTMVIHRGHSYHLSSTLERLAPSAKVVLLGSCGGYQSLNKVLNTCPEAQIIASKQTGSGSINQPMITAMMETLRQGKDLDWPVMWKNFTVQFKGNQLFDDYIPPYKNLGAVFIIAYTKLEEKETDQ